tara:strand:- start:32 stop:451 length:420 start_codon:yes stop_codon:yes gene_type:complete
MNNHHESYRAYLEALTPQSLEQLADYVAADVRFTDPFNDVRGADAMRRVLSHMFDTVGPVVFRVSHMASDGNTCLMRWTFSGKLRGRAWTFEGMSTIRFNADGLVSEHADYWDGASALYEKLPVIGTMLAWIRRRLAIH